MADYLNDNIGPDEMVAICWLYATVKRTECKCHLFIKAGDPEKQCIRCNSLYYARKAWPYTVGVIEGNN